MKPLGFVKFYDDLFSGSRGRLLLLFPGLLLKREYALCFFISDADDGNILAAFYAGFTDRNAREVGVLYLVALSVGNLLESRDS